ncbi:hypothetical protein [Virgibacillus halodenitrificans]|uniref:hypothetical protein n=1 Tax=Virgibacillus halodenitrificans TaxID=1482 RepID=UPI0002E01942|nr:hypothetical protein [Virgibacillus halodenitrificans]
MEPEKVFINANILTLDENNNIAGSIAVSGNKIIQIYKEKIPMLLQWIYNPSQKLLIWEVEQ